MKLRKADISDFGVIALWLSKPENYFDCGGTEIKPWWQVANEVLLFWDIGRVYIVEIDFNPAGFVVIGKDNIFHLFLIPEKRTLENAVSLLEDVFSICFNDLKLNKIYTCANDRQAKYLRWSNRMKDENRIKYNKELFSLTKKGFLCR